MDNITAETKLRGALELVIHYHNLEIERLELENSNLRGEVESLKNQTKECCAIIQDMFKRHTALRQALRGLVKDDSF